VLALAAETMGLPLDCVEEMLDLVGLTDEEASAAYVTTSLKHHLIRPTSAAEALGRTYPSTGPRKLTATPAQMRTYAHGAH
jgi:hypothetical protein